MPVYHSGKLSGTDRPDFTLPLRPQTPDLTVPLAPRNPMATSPYQIGFVDVRWDNPKLIPQNSGLTILGCNVYRSTDAEFGPYVKVNDAPVSVFFYRDKTEEAYVSGENATPTLRTGVEPDGRWLVYTQNKPIIVPGSNGTTSNRVEDVLVEVDDGDGQFLTIPAYKVSGKMGEIQLISEPVYNNTVQQVIPPRLPWPPTGRVRLSYRWLKHSVITVLSQRIFYKVTTVAVDPSDSSKTIETPLGEVADRSTFDIEMLDYIWKEAMRRQRWILEQGGERVKVFVRKWMGTPCPGDHGQGGYQDNYGQGHQDCLKCFGTGVVGGYAGPYDIIIAPPESEKTVELADMGLHIRYDWDTWTQAYPLIQSRDFIVRQNNERYIVGTVNPQGSRGAIYQQHFTMSWLDQGDIRHKVPIEGGETDVPASYDPYRQPAPTDASPAINDKPSVPKERIIKGRTVTFENITW